MQTSPQAFSVTEHFMLLTFYASDNMRLLVVSTLVLARVRSFTHSAVIIYLNIPAELLVARFSIYFCGYVNRIRI